MKVILKHPDTGMSREVKKGFSWTMFFFGFFVPMVRGDWKWFGISLLLGIFTAGIGNIVLSFFYNKIYIRELLEKGWVPIETHDEIVKAYVS